MEKQVMAEKRNRYTRQKKKNTVVRLSLFLIILFLINLPALFIDIEYKIPWKTLNAPSLAMLELIDTSRIIENNVGGLGHIMIVSIPNALLYLLILVLLNKLLITKIRDFLHI